MADKSVDGVTFSAAFLDSGEADRQRIADEVEAEHKAKLAQAMARTPNGGAYTADGPAPPVQGALLMPPGFVGDMASRSAARRVGKECVCTCSYRWSP